ncbi:hypothetical protein HWV62_29150 [Athelia sp. TMB]|nr:hypothetical protein HWV62_29150 [Athelia sp. TMB]
MNIDKIGGHKRSGDAGSSASPLCSKAENVQGRVHPTLQVPWRWLSWPDTLVSSKPLNAPGASSAVLSTVQVQGLRRTNHDRSSTTALRLHPALGIRWLMSRRLTVGACGTSTFSDLDASLMLQRGQAMGVEFHGKDVNVALGPIESRAQRGGTQLGGRGRRSIAQNITGMQSQGAIVCAKHFALNEQEEHYRGGEAHAPVATAACENRHLLNTVFKDELDFQGFMLSGLRSPERHRDRDGHSQETGNSVLDILSGAVNPNARLPFTMAKQRSDYERHSVLGRAQQQCVHPADRLHREAQCVPISPSVSSYTDISCADLDYKWFEAENIAPRYEFSYGLSYMTFTCLGLSLNAAFSSSSSSPSAAAAKASTSNRPGGESGLYGNALTTSFSVKNAGDEVAQLYLGFPAAVGEPPRVLRGFARKYVEKGESASFSIGPQATSIWDVITQSWVIATGEFVVCVGSSSRQLKLTKTFTL